MVEQRADLRGQRRVGHHLGPEQQQVVVVEHVLLLLGVDVGAEQFLQFVLPLAAPGEGALQHLVQRLAGIDHARIDRQAGALERKALLGLRQADLVAHHAHQVFGIAAVVDGERLLQADAPRVLAQQARADAVEGAGPGQVGKRLRCGKPSTRCSTPPTRRSISWAARRLKVSSSMRCGSAPWRIRRATRCASVLVLPDPAPAMTSSGRVSAAVSPVPWGASRAAR